MRSTKLIPFLILGLVLWTCSPTSPNQSGQRESQPSIDNQRPQGRSGGPPGGRGRYNPEADNKQGDTYNINLDAEDCDIDIEKELKINSLYKEVLNEAKNKRTITINSIASHNVGAFPNSGNPNTIRQSKMSFSIPLKPEIAKRTTSAQGFDSGVLFSGVSIDPFTAEFFTGSDGQMNPQWNITTLTNTENLGLDCNNAHVQPTGKYHYHGTPSAYLFDLSSDGTKMIKLGYAADGFPMYYKYGYNENGKIIAHNSGYELKTGERPGDGITAPDGPYNGRYFNDYKYKDDASELDACNGRWGKTPESDNEYYYVVTDNFPSVPLCFSGTPSNDLNKRMGNGERPPGPPRGRGQRPPGGRRGFGGGDE